MTYGLETRTKRYRKLSTALARISDQNLVQGLSKLKSNAGWGDNQIMKIGREKIFVKRIPVTDKELANAYSTKNNYQIPTYYNYGVGSAGFGVFREIYSHVKTTDWVLGDDCQSFPLMYHHRIIRNARKPAKNDEEFVRGYVRYWNGSQRVGNYINDRAATSSEVLIFLEFIPFSAAERVPKHIDEYESLLNDMLATAKFLQTKNVIHFDAHMMNVLTDGKRNFLTDYGLVLDKEFELTEKERVFFKRNELYDSGQLINSLSHAIAIAIQRNNKLSKQISLRYELKDKPYPEVMKIILNNLEDIVASGVRISPKLQALMIRYTDILLLMENFYHEMRRGSKKNIKFEHAKLKRLLKNAGVI